MAHLYRVTVRFGDCDPAGIVYFPVIFDWMHQAMEDWFDRGLGVPYATVIGERRIGFPAVHSEADFHAPCRLGETLEIALSVGRIGRTSLQLDYAVADRATARTVVAVVDLDTLRPIPLPEDLRTRMQRSSR